MKNKITTFLHIKFPLKKFERFPLRSLKVHLSDRQWQFISNLTFIDNKGVPPASSSKLYTMWAKFPTILKVVSISLKATKVYPRVPITAL